MDSPRATDELAILCDAHERVQRLLDDLTRNRDELLAPGPSRSPDLTDDLLAEGATTLARAVEAAARLSAGVAEARSAGPEGDPPDLSPVASVRPT